MSRASHSEVWHSLGAQDPDWAVESAPGMKHRGWDAALDEFYAIGQRRIDEILTAIPAVGLESALDWGSGTGRLSFALAGRFAQVTCVDISDTMLATLRERAKERGINNLSLIRLEEFVAREGFDLAVSLITLQHLPSRGAVKDAIETMASALRPSGHLYVDLPTHPHNVRYRVQPRLQVYRVLRRLGVSPGWLHCHGMSGISMLCAPTTWMSDVLEAAGLEVKGITEQRHTSHQQAAYVARKPVPVAPS